MADQLTAIPNVGPAVARYLRRVDVRELADLRGQDPQELFDRLCAIDGHRYDPCLLDTFVAAVAFADGEPPRPWWTYSRERKLCERGGGPQPA